MGAILPGVMAGVVAVLLVSIIVPVPQTTPFEYQVETPGCTVGMILLNLTGGTSLDLNWHSDGSPVTVTLFNWLPSKEWIPPSSVPPIYNQSGTHDNQVLSIDSSIYVLHVATACPYPGDVNVTIGDSFSHMASPL
jgi:hypothetical protein